MTPPSRLPRPRLVVMSLALCLCASVMEPRVMDALREAGVPFRENEPFARHTSMGVGGPAAVMAFPRSAEELRKTLRVRGELEVPHRVLGGGSNLVVVDEGLDELVVNTEEMSRVAIGGGRRRDRRGRGQPDPHRRALLPRGLARPGERVRHPRLGRRRRGDERGGLRLLDQRRADARSSSTTRTASGSSLPRAGASTTAARRSPKGSAVAKVTVELRPDDPAALEKETGELSRQRTKSQPGGRNAGCVFKNPEGGHGGTASSTSSASRAPGSAGRDLAPARELRGERRREPGPRTCWTSSTSCASGWQRETGRGPRARGEGVEAAGMKRSGLPVAGLDVGELPLAARPTSPLPAPREAHEGAPRPAGPRRPRGAGPAPLSPWSWSRWPRPGRATRRSWPATGSRWAGSRCGAATSSPKGEVRELLGPAVGENILGLDIDGLKARLRSSPWVADATVAPHPARHPEGRDQRAGAPGPGRGRAALPHGRGRRPDRALRPAHRGLRPAHRARPHGSRRRGPARPRRAGRGPARRPRRPGGRGLGGLRAAHRATSRSCCAARARCSWWARRPTGSGCSTFLSPAQGPDRALPRRRVLRPALPRTHLREAASRPPAAPRRPPAPRPAPRRAAPPSWPLPPRPPPWRRRPGDHRQHQ